MEFIKKHYLLFLVLILFAGFILRLYRLDNPIADWHSWRQADTSAVSRNFVKNGFDLLHPRFDDLSNVPSGLDNPHGYRFVEFPIYNIKQALLFKTFGVLTLEEWGRIVTILGSVLSGMFLFLIVSRHSNKTLGIFSAFFYMFIPYNIYYGRTILPDPLMVTASLGGTYFFDRWIEEKSKVKSQSLFILLSILLTSSAFLLKPYALFFTLPMVVLVYQKFGLAFFKKWQLWIFTIISIAPLVFWRIWIMQYPEGIPASAWLLNGNGIRFHPAFFRWIFYERITKLISGYLGVIILLTGIWKVKTLKEWVFFSSFLLSSLIYVCVFATGNVQHDYYQILIMPSLSIFFAIGSYYLYSFSYKKLPIGKVVLTISLFSLFWFGWMQVKDYFNINNRSMIAAGKAVDRLTPKNAKVIANYNGDTSFLYQTNRQGWASMQNPIPEMIQKGADYLILLDPSNDDINFGRDYKIVEKTPQYVIFDLRK